MKIEYITSNRPKFEEAQYVLNEFEIEQVPLELTEIQGNYLDVTKAKAKEALRLLNRPLIVEDISLFCPAIQGLPGPYIKDFLKALGVDGFCELIHKYQDRSCQAIVAAYIAPGIEPHLFEGVLDGTILAPRGGKESGAYGWATLFQPLHSEKTFGELSLKELSAFSMRSLALKKLRVYLEKTKNNG